MNIQSNLEINFHQQDEVSVFLKSTAAGDKEEKKAALLIPARRLPGMLGLGTQSKDTKVEASHLMGYYLDEYWNFMAPQYYWFDGQSSLLDAAMEKPSASKLETPKMITTIGSRLAPATPATTANVVIMPSLAP